MKDKIINNNQPDQDLKKSEDDLNLKNLKYFSTISLSKPKETEGKLVFLLLSGDPDVVDDNLKGELKKQKPFSLASLTRILLLLAKVKKFKNIIVIGGTTLQRFNIAINEEKPITKLYKWNKNM